MFCFNLSANVGTNTACLLPFFLTIIYKSYGFRKKVLYLLIMEHIETIDQRRFNKEVNNQYNYSDDELYLVSDRSVLPSFYTVRRPFRPLSGCCVRILEGEAEYILNLITYRMRTGDILFVPENSIFEIVLVSDDIVINLFSYYHIQLDYIRTPHYGHVDDPAVVHRLDNYFNMMLEIASEEKKIGISHLQMAYIEESLPYMDTIADASTGKSTREREIFNRFIDLVNAHAGKERSVPYYADALAITPNWLSNVIKSYSGKTVLHWISSAVVQLAKIRLAYFEKPVYLIADELNFSSPVDFSRFFHRETGMTPTEFRAKLKD